MYNPLRALIFLLALLLSQPGFGQSLLQDIQLLEQHKKALARGDLSDSLKTVHSATILAILDHYRQGTGDDATRSAVPTANDIWNAYRQNPSFSKLIDTSTLSVEALPDVFATAFLDTKTRLQSGPRERIRDLLQAEYALSPTEYLSVGRTIEDYTQPPLPSISFMKTAAQSSNKNVSKGIVDEAAIIIGLFNFLLDRGKEEVVIAFLDRLLGERGVADLEALFPTTVAIYGNRDFTYSESFLERLRDALYRDLQQLSVTLPELLGNSEYYDLWKNDPLSFSFLQIYTMVGLAQQEVPLSEIIPLTFRSLFERYKDEEKAFNLRIVDTAYTFPEYDRLPITSGQIVQQIRSINKVLNEQEEAIRSSLDNTFFGDLESLLLEDDTATAPPADSAGVAVDMPIDTTAETGDDEAAAVSTPDTTAMEEEVFMFSIPVIEGDYQNLDAILNGNEDRGYSLEMLPGLLRGQVDVDIAKDWSTLDSYDRYLRNPLTEQQMRAAGLELARQLSGKWYQERSIVEVLRAWHQDVLEYRLAAQQYEAERDPGKLFREDALAFDKAKTNLVNTLQIALNFNDQGLPPSESQNLKLRLQVLNKVLDDSYIPGGFGLDGPELLLRKWEELWGVEYRLRELNDQFSSALTSAGINPIDSYFQSQEIVDPLQELSKQINSLERLIDRLDRELQALDTKVLRKEYEALQHITPLVQLTGVLSQMMYAFRSDHAQDQWIGRRQLDSVLFDNSQRPLFLGLLQQQLKETQVMGTFSVNGLSNLVRSTVNDLSLLQPDTIGGIKDTMVFFRKAMFASNAINRLLQLPILTDPANPAKGVSLLDRYPALDPIPGLSNQTLDFIYYLNIKDHRHAMSSLIRLLTKLIPVVAEAVPAKAPVPAVPAVSGTAAGKPAKEDIPMKQLRAQIPDKGRKALEFLEKYGPFIADLIDADSSQQVQNLLEGISDPPGSSRIKRREPFTANINGYLGGLIGGERLSGEALSAEEAFATFAPTIPVGISFSRLIGKGPKAQSFSLFLSILDLGSLTTFQLGESIEGEDQLSFKNVLKPGLQLHWNIKRSPFFLGVGGQYGPQFREFDGVQKQLRSFRYFFNFGVDVVIKRLY